MGAFQSSFEDSSPLNSPTRREIGSVDPVGRRKLEQIKSQNFHSIKSQCCKAGNLWVDPLFPAEYGSIYLDGKSRFPIQWLRPTEICKETGRGYKPEFFLRGGSRFDLVQGDLGDCWLIAAAASIAERPELLVKVVPDMDSADFDPDTEELGTGYAGIFRFQFYHYGEWVEVCVDDRLPTFHGRLLMVQSRTSHEFWGPLLEKAYAKLFGCYEALKGGVCSDALTDLTGGMCETFRLKSGVSPAMDKMLFRAIKRQALICTGIWGDGQHETMLPNGLAAGHAYTVTDMERVRCETPLGPRAVTMIRIRNPWGNKVEWNGPWSDESRLWDKVSVEQKMEMKLRLRNDGEFWMDLKDFKRTFDDVDICYVAPDDLTERVRRKWRMSSFHGEWHGPSAGGRMKYRTFAMNPQFAIRVRDEYDSDRSASVIIELTQKSRRRVAKTNLNFGFVLFPLPYLERLPLSYQYFESHERTGAVDYYTNLRAVTKRFLVDPGRYVIVPTTWEPGESGEFMIRVWSEAASFENDSLPPVPEAIGNQYLNGLYNSERKEFEEEGGLDDSDDASSTSSGSTIKVERELDAVFLNGSVASDRTERPGSAESLPKMTSFRAGANMNPKVKNSASRFFKAVAGKDNRITAFELQRGLNLLYSMSESYYFSIEACKAMMLYIQSEDYQMGFDEFCNLFKGLDRWTNVFLSQDSDNNGSLDFKEFRSAVDRLGFGELAEIQTYEYNRNGLRKSFSQKEKPKLEPRENKLQKIFQFTFSDETGKISYSNFILAVLRLQMIRDKFDNFEKANGQDDWVKFTMNEWLQNAALP